MGLTLTRSQLLLFSCAGAALAVGGAVLMLSLNPWWALAGAAAGSLAAGGGLCTLAVRAAPNPDKLLREGRPDEAAARLWHMLPTARSLAGRLPMFRDGLAAHLGKLAEAFEATSREPHALDAAGEAVAIYQQLSAARPGWYDADLAAALIRQSRLLSALGRHGEALGAAQAAVRLYRRLAVAHRASHLPALADALARQAEELGYLDRLPEARTAAAEATLIRTDMLPAAPL